MSLEILFWEIGTYNALCLQNLTYSEAQTILTFFMANEQTASQDRNRFLGVMAVKFLGGFSSEKKSLDIEDR